MLKLLVVLCFSASFLFGWVLPVPQSSADFGGVYLLNDDVQSYNVDSSSQHGTDYKIVPLSRKKRTPPMTTTPAPDKSVLQKQTTDAKKPTGFEKVTTTSTVSSVSGGVWLNRTQGTPTAEEIARKNANNNGPVKPHLFGNKFNESEDDDVDHVHHPDFPIDWETLQKNLTFLHDNNITNVEIDRYDEQHKYYNSSFFTNGSLYWMDIDSHPSTEKHELLSSAHRRAATLQLGFQFPFYGHPIKNVTVATGGFIYLGDQVHAWLAATQYVAPLMANFDSSFSHNASVKFLSNGEVFTVQWTGVTLQDSSDTGAFTFQTSLYNNGTIVFAYKNLPIPIKEINDTNHPVKVGLSEAYIRERSVFLVKQKTIYEYDRVALHENDNITITSGSAIVFTPLLTCVSLTTCEMCNKDHPELTFNCSWCAAANRCSDGTDRYRHDWLAKGCDRDGSTVKDALKCSFVFPSTTTTQYHVDSNTNYINHDDASSSQVYKERTEPEGMSAAGVIGVLFLCMLIFGGLGWVAYAYMYPHSPSGQLLIRYRPSQWGFRRGEARYTAASIHM